MVDLVRKAGEKPRDLFDGERAADVGIDLARRVGLRGRIAGQEAFAYRSRKAGLQRDVDVPDGRLRQFFFEPNIDVVEMGRCELLDRAVAERWQYVARK